MITRPDKSEYDPYYDVYVSKVGQEDVLERLECQIQETVQLVQNVGGDQAGYRYAPDKWSIKQVIGHMADTERIFAYRALCFARRDETPLPGFEQDEYVERANFDDRPLEDIVEEFRCVRAATIALFAGVDDEILMRKGTASGCPFTVRTIPYILAGHELHHLGVLKERYL